MSLLVSIYSVQKSHRIRSAFLEQLWLCSRKKSDKGEFTMTLEPVASTGISQSFWVG